MYRFKFVYLIIKKNDHGKANIQANGKDML